MAYRLLKPRGWLQLATAVVHIQDDMDFLREMAPPGRGCVVWTFGLVSAPSYPRHLSHSQPHALATHVNSGAAGLRPPPLFSTINPRLNFHAIRSAVRLPRASQPCSYP